MAGGTGLAPILSIVRATLESGNRQPVYLYFGVRSEADLYGSRVLAELQQRYTNLDVHIVMASGPINAGHRGGLVPDAIAADWQGTQALRDFRGYVCGSPPMVDAVTQTLVAQGLDSARIYADAFFTKAPTEQVA